MKKLTKNAPNESKIKKRKDIKKMDNFHVYMCSHTASIESTTGNKTRLFPSTFLISTGWFLILAKASRNDHVADSTTVLRSATEKNEKWVTTQPFRVRLK